MASLLWLDIMKALHMFGSINCENCNRIFDKRYVFLQPTILMQGHKNQGNKGNFSPPARKITGLTTKVVLSSRVMRGLASLRTLLSPPRTSAKIGRFQSTFQ